jgi:hypothetical protein
MGFVVKSSGLGFSATWLSPRSDIGTYTLGPRKTALVFSTDAEAQAAVVEAAESFKQLGVILSVESAD